MKIKTFFCIPDKIEEHFENWKKESNKTNTIINHALQNTTPEGNCLLTIFYHEF